MKTTIEINDQLFASARAAAERNGLTLRSMVDQGLRMVLKSISETKSPQRRLEIRVFDGKVGLTPEFHDADWSTMKDEVRRR